MLPNYHEQIGHLINRYKGTEDFKSDNMRSGGYVVFLLPVIISVLFGSFVLGDVLGEPDRQLNLWPFDLSKVSVHTESLQVEGLLRQYSASDKVEIEVVVLDETFDCGDLYVTIYDLSSSPRQVITQSGYFEQCFAQNNLSLPIDEEFSEEIRTPGTYEIVVELNDRDNQKTITATERFTVR